MPRRRPQISVLVNRFFRRTGARLNDIGAMLVSPIERTFRTTTRRALGAVEGIQRVESVFGRLGRAITWPFRALGSMLAAMVPESFTKLASAPFRALSKVMRGLGWALMRMAEHLNLDWLVVWIVWLLQPVWRPLAAMWGFFLAWVGTRKYKRILWGIPALVLLMPIAYVAARTFLFGSGGVAAQYRLAVRESLNEDDFRQVQLYERKLAQLGVNTQLTDYRTADALARADKLDEAYDRMRQLAPEDQPGYPAAHFWIIQRLLANQLSISDEEVGRLIQVHLNHLESLGIRGPELQFMKAMSLMREQRLAEAADLLKPLVVRMQQAAVQRLRINLVLDNHKEAREDARFVRIHMEDRTRRSQLLTSADYQIWIAAEEILGSERKLKSILQKWVGQDPKNSQAQQALTSITRIEFEQLMRSRSFDGEQLATALLEAMRFSNKRTDFAQLAISVYENLASTDDSNTAIALLLESSSAPSALLEALGTAAAMDSDWQRSTAFLQRATAVDPDNDVAWNNYAWVFINRQSPDLQQALAAVNKALAISPNEFRYRETRGQIFVKLQRWQEAIADLEIAVNGIPDSREIHLALASAYQAIGKKELAQAHREHAE